MAQKKQRRHKVRATLGAQAGLALDLPEISVSEVAVGPRAVHLQFEDADPRGIWVGRKPLADHLRDTGMGWVLAVRTFMRQRDWTQFEAAYKGGGRPAHHPAVMLSLALFGTMFGQTSLRDLETLARADVRVWWLTGGAMPDHSAIGRFIERHTHLITESFFEDLTKAVVGLMGTPTGTIANDATVVQAACSRLATIKQEAAREAAAEAKAKAYAAPEDEKLATKAELAQEVLETAQKRSAERKAKGRANTDAPVSPMEPEARVQPMKNGQVAPSYLACIAVDANRVITGQKIESSSEPAAVPHLVEQSERVMGVPVTTVLGDGRYNTGELHHLAEKKGFELLAPASSTDQSSQDGKHFGKARFVFDEATNAYTCPAGEVLEPYRRHTDRDGRKVVDYQTKADCTQCPFANQCIRGKGNRSILRYEHDQAKEDLAKKMTQPEVRERYSRRQVMVEPVFAETKYIQGEVRFLRRGLRGAALEHSLHCCAHNLRRALRVKIQSTRRGAKGAGSSRAAGQRQSGSIWPEHRRIRQTPCPTIRHRGSWCLSVRVASANRLPTARGVLAVPASV